MKRYCLLIGLLLFPLLGFTQYMRVSSFNPLPSDMEARLNYEKTPDEDPCILIKMVTTYKNFDIDVGGAILCKIEGNKKPSEIWIWVTPNVRKLRIQHKDLGLLDFRIPIRIERKTVYEMVLKTTITTTVIEEATPGFLVVGSAPNEANVYINDIQTKERIASGKTPLEKPLAVGTYKVRVVKVGYAPFEQTVSIVPEETKYINANLKSTQGMASIKSNPMGAKVIIDGMDMGTTPLNRRLPEGTHQVEIEKDLYASVQFTINIQQGETTRVEKNLKSDFGTLQIESTPNADINIDKELVGHGSIDKKIASGTYYVTIEKRGFFSVKKMVVVKKGQTTSLALPLKKQEGILQLKSKPTGATVYINHKKVGKTPLIKKLPVGRHEVEIRKSGYATAKEYYEIIHEKTTVKNVRLDKEFAYTAPEPKKKDKPSQATSNNVPLDKAPFQWGIRLGGGIANNAQRTNESNSNNRNLLGLPSPGSRQAERNLNTKSEAVAYGGGLWATYSLSENIHIGAAFNYEQLNGVDFKYKGTSTINDNNNSVFGGSSSNSSNNSDDYLYDVNIKKISMPILLSFGRNLRIGGGLNFQNLFSIENEDNYRKINLESPWFMGWISEVKYSIDGLGIGVRAYTINWKAENLVASVNLYVRL